MVYNETGVRKMPNWTDEQLAAINARNHTILVSAAAGSGKTAVLVERIVQLIREDYELDRMLIVTFTRAAAGEMRQRLAARLTKEAKFDPERFGKALEALEHTDISTIHAFCQHVLRQEFQAVGIDPMSRVCEDQQRQGLFEEAYRHAMNELLEEGEKDLLALTERFDQQALMDMSSSLYAFLMSMPEPFVWLEKQVDAEWPENLHQHPWFQTVMQEVKLEITGLSEMLAIQQQMFDESDAVEALMITFQQDVELVRTLCQKLQDDKQLISALQTTSFPRAATCRKLTEEQKNWKDRFTAIRKEIIEQFKSCCNDVNMVNEDTLIELQSIQGSLRGLQRLMERLHQHFMQLKNDAHVLDFSDLEQMTLQVLSIPACREKLQEEYDHLFVDECQDVSAVQDAIVQAVHGECSCLFMVGDVKQSIYRFRLADPTLFLHRMHTFSDDPMADERRIFLQKNFRSRNNVLDVTNRVFSRAMKQQVTELDYLPEDMLICGREKTKDDPPAEIHLIRRNAENKSAARNLESEAAVVVKRIQQLLHMEMEENGVRRNYTYRDMVILLRKKAGVGARLAELLEEMGIPVYYDGSDHYFELPEIRTLKAILEVVDNPLQDVYFLTVLKHHPFNLTDGELANIRSCKTGRDVPFWQAFAACCRKENSIGEKCRSVQKQIQEWRFQKEAMRLSDFVWKLLRDSGFYAACGAYPEGELRQANLRLLCQRAATYEQQQPDGLSGFLKMIDLQMSQPDSLGAKVLGENEDLVRIMTMHKSKGLEFPIVFCMCLGESKTGKKSGKLQMHNRLGVCLPYVNRKLSICRAGLGEQAFQFQKNLDELAERCRLLYVAMTRARERLILTGCYDEKSVNTWIMQDSPYRVWAVRDMMDWVMQMVFDENKLRSLPDQGISCPAYTVTIEPDEGIEHRQTPRDAALTQEWIQELVMIPANPRAFPWWHTQEQHIEAPIKTSVSSLTRMEVLKDPLPLSDEDELIEDKRASEEIMAPLRLSELPARPAFMEEKRMTGAERGTMMHRFLSLTDLAPLKGQTGTALMDAIRLESSRMMASGCFQQGEMDMVQLSSIAAFYESLLGQRILASKEVRREWSFNLRLSGESITLLQGIIDCAFLEGNDWVLLDYKTDHILDESAFVQRHERQLNWYGAALERITGRQVKEMWLYALGQGKAYAVTKRQEGMCFT